MNSYHAIEIIGTGKRRAYVVKKVSNGLLIPESKPYRTEEAARSWATENGIEIAKVGGLWNIIKEEE